MGTPATGRPPGQHGIDFSPLWRSLARVLADAENRLSGQEAEEEKLAGEIERLAKETVA